MHGLFFSTQIALASLILNPYGAMVFGSALACHPYLGCGRCPALAAAMAACTAGGRMQLPTAEEKSVEGMSGVRALPWVRVGQDPELEAIRNPISDNQFGLGVHSPIVDPPSLPYLMDASLMEPAVASLFGALVHELSIAVYTTETSEQATALLSSQLEFLRLHHVNQEPTETPLSAAKVPRLGAAGVELLDAEAGPGYVRYENQRETRFRLVEQVDKVRGMNGRPPPPWLRDAPFEQIACWLREHDYDLARVLSFVNSGQHIPRIMQRVGDDDLPPVTVGALLLDTSPYQRAMVWANSTQEVARDEYIVGLQLAALRQVIRSRDPNTARMVEFLLQAPGFVVEPRADLDLEPPLWTAVRERGVPGQTKVIHLLLSRRADPDRSFQGQGDALATSARQLANDAMTGIMDVLIHCEHELDGCTGRDFDPED